jgi:hypothetical protein
LYPCWGNRPFIQGFPTLALLFVINLPGCGSPAPPGGQVFGKVTFEGNPVTEGTISFLNREAGVGDEASLTKDGAYALPKALPVGDYQVMIMPLTVTEKDPFTGEPAAVEKPAPNIPRKHRTIAFTDLKATVIEGKNEHNFDMKR